MTKHRRHNRLQHTYPGLGRSLSLFFFGRALSAPRHPLNDGTRTDAEIAALLVPLQRHLMAQRLYVSLWRILLIAVLVASLTLLIAGVAVALPLPLAPLLTGAVTIIVGLYAAAWAHPSPWQVATLLDRRLGLHEQITTALNVRDQGTSLARLLRARTHDLLRTLDPAASLPRPSFRREYAVSLPLLVLFAICLLLAAERPLPFSSHGESLTTARGSRPHRSPSPHAASHPSQKPLVLHFYTDPTSQPGEARGSIPPPAKISSTPLSSSHAGEPPSSARASARGGTAGTSSKPGGQRSPTSPTRGPAPGAEATRARASGQATPRANAAQRGSASQMTAVARTQQTRQDPFSTLQQKIARAGATGQEGTTTARRSAQAMGPPSRAGSGGKKGAGQDRAGGRSSSTAPSARGRGAPMGTHNAVGGTGHMPLGQKNEGAGGGVPSHGQGSARSARLGAKGVTLGGQTTTRASAPFVLGQAAPGLWVGDGNGSEGPAASGQDGTAAPGDIGYLPPDSNAVLGVDPSVIRDYFVGQ